MADILPNSIPDDELRARWGGFAFTAENEATAKTVIGRYPPGRQQSAIIPLLDL
ncbi:MAG TPA: NAD(P)H-dependent oxidoreductase subunit E, partial [Allosphingosinicella sp.]|nr:NAD(P)H-dependent oxidoreductase subunit E [Allosphingosinicella sp.]